MVCMCLQYAEPKAVASGSVYFNGTTNSYMQWSSTLGGDARNYTLEFWFRPDSVTNQTVFIYNNPNYSQEDVFVILLNPDGSIAANIRWGNGDCTIFNNSVSSGPNLINPGQWQHVAITRNDTCDFVWLEPQHIPLGWIGCINLYLNGGLVATNVDSMANASSYCGAFTWGNFPPPLLGEGFAGAIGEFRLWSRALSQVEIQTKMTQVLNPTNETGLQGYWRFSEGISNIVYDLAGTNIGIIYGASWSADLPDTILQPPSIFQQPTNQTVFNGMSNVVLNVGATGSQPMFYQWSFANTNIPGATSSAFTITKAGLTNLGVYSVVITNLAGTMTSSNAILTMHPFLATPFAGTVVLWGQDATLSVSPAGTGPFTYQWFENGIPLAGGTNRAFTIPSIQFTNAGFYSVVVTSAFGSVTNTAAQVVVNPAGVSLGMYPGLTVTGTVGYVYSIQSTPSLSNTNGWITLTNLTLQQSPELWFDSNVRAFT